ncbi:MAG: glycoside hydrolase family 92 protein [Bacteroidales bacterium]|nr:glycoside hydrolase family 92 protein [Bacteroidales bacterium]
MKHFRLFVLLLLCSLPGALAAAQSPTDYVDPHIGLKGNGGVTIGPAAPFGMVKPGPDCRVNSGYGWQALDKPVLGFSQTHNSGTGGGPKYGNILIQPFVGTLDETWHPQLRSDEEACLGYYRCDYAGTGLRTEITASERAVFYRFGYPKTRAARAAGEAVGPHALSLDAGFFLGNQGTGYPKEEQHLVGSEVRILSDHEVEGYTRVRGGWNGGRAYTCYFYLVADHPFVETRTWKGERLLRDSQVVRDRIEISRSPWQADEGKGTGVLLRFADDAQEVNIKLGVSHLGCLKARQNAGQELPHWSFDRARADLVARWESLLGRVEIAPGTPPELLRMFYTGLYHCYLHPVDKTGENPLWNDGEPYFDDYYALWDTFRTSLPLMMLLTPGRAADFCRSLLSTYRHEGYLPDGRSGHCTGLTQGGSNADLVLADAFLRGLPGIDWELALEAVLKDADVPPGGEEEAQGRGGLREYNTLGYVPYGIPRAGTRTLEYARCDYSIYLLAQGLGRDSLVRKRLAAQGIDLDAVAARFLRQSGNWRNLWRADCESNGFRGFIMPRDRSGQWLDSIPAYPSKVYPTPGIDGGLSNTAGTAWARAGYDWTADLTPGWPHLAYSPVTREPHAFCTNWEKFFYEGTGWIYSWSVPQDVPGLIEACGGPGTFQARLDEFLYKGYFSVNNEPAFFVPCLYHWIGRPDLTGEIVRKTIAKEFNDSWKGLPGNDDTGATSTWLVFHLMGLYPVAGQDLYILHAPLLSETVLHLDAGDLIIRAEGLSDTNRFIQSVILNGRDFPYSTLRHADLAAGGELILKMGPAPSPAWPRSLRAAGHKRQLKHRK